MKRQKQITMAVLIATLAGGLAVKADPVLIVSDGVTTTGPITLTGGSGNYSTSSFDSSWSVVVSGAESKPLVGGTSNPNMQLSITATSLGSPNPLTIILSDNNFGPTSGSQNAIAQLFGAPVAGSGSDITFNTYYDSSDAIDSLTTLLTSSGSVLPNGGGTYASYVTNSLSLSGAYSLTEVVQIDGNTAATYSLSANLQATNEACACSLNFSCVPTNLTVCQPLFQSYCQPSWLQFCQSYGQPTQIPNPVYEACLIKATDSCLGSVPVEFLGAVTNQMCPTNGFCFITNGTCFFPNGICCPTNGLFFATNGICFVTNGVCCATHNCSLNFQGCCLSSGNCFPSYVNCSQSFGSCTPSYGTCSKSFGGCFGTYGNNCSQSYGSYGNCSLSNQCSTVITFTFGATNGCGNLQAVTQTVTLQHCQSCFNVTCSQPPPQNCYPPNCYQPSSCYQYPSCYQQAPSCYQQPTCYQSQPSCYGGYGFGSYGSGCFGR